MVGRLGVRGGGGGVGWVVGGRDDSFVMEIEAVWDLRRKGRTVKG